MKIATRSRTRAYGIAVCSVAAALAVTLLLTTLMTQAALPLFLGAVIVSLRVGGRGPGLLATVLSIIASIFLLHTPMGAKTIAAGSRNAGVIALVVFVFVAALINSLGLARVRAEEATQRAKDEYQSIFENAITGIYRTTPDGRYLAANPMLAHMFGYDSVAQLLDTGPDINARFYVLPGRREEFMRAVSEQGGVTGFESEIFRRDGSRMWISEHARAIRDDSGAVIAFQGATIDITGRKWAEESLRHVHDELEMRVAERTAELARANDTLRVEIAERGRAETELRTSHEQLRSLSAYLQSIREEERTSIAREIHDELGQTLTALMMDLSWLEDRAAKLKDAAAGRPLLEKTGAMMKLVHQTMDTVRQIAAELRPAVLDELGLLAAIEWQAGDFERRTGIQCRLRSSLEEVDLGREAATAVFRILQESLTNIARHAGASAVELALEEAAGNLVLHIEDNGGGITAGEMSDPHALGLLGMRERALLLGGEVKIEGATGRGTSVRVSLPLGAARTGGTTDAERAGTS